MALFTDGMICDQEVLREYESSILEVARTEEVELTAKLRVAQREIGFEIATFLQRNGSQYLTPDRSLSNVAVTESLRHWHAVHSLAVVYRDAYFRHLNDRFKEKWGQYSLLGQESKRRCFIAGIGVVAEPLPRPRFPAWQLVPGGAMQKREYLIAIALQHGESVSAACDPAAVEADAGTLVQVRFSQNPLGGRWLVYAGSGEGNLVRQTDVSLAGGTNWTESANGIVTAGESPSEGQRPDVVVRLMNFMDRG